MLLSPQIVTIDSHFILTVQLFVNKKEKKSFH